MVQEVSAKWRQFVTKHIYIILEFCLAISSTSAPIQKVFSLTNGLKKNRFLVEAIKAVIMTETNFRDFSYDDFYNIVLDKLKLLQEIRSSTICKTSAQQEQPTPSTSSGN